jgi:hypothetical protein
LIQQPLWEFVAGKIPLVDGNVAMAAGINDHPNF